MDFFLLHGAGTLVPYKELGVASLIISRFNLEIEVAVPRELAETEVLN